MLMSFSGQWPEAGEPGGRGIKRRLGIALLAAALQACGGGGESAVEAGQAAPSETAQRHAAASSSTIAIGEPGGPADSGAAVAKRRFTGMGMNLPSIDYWSTEFPTIDQFKRAGGWLTSCDGGQGSCTFTKQEQDAGKGAWDTLEQDKLDLDENGWVRSLPAAGDGSVKYRHVTAMVFGGDEGAHSAGVYTVLYDGDGEIEYAGSVKNLQRGLNRDQMEISNESDSQFYLRIRRTTVGNHVRNIRVVPPGGVCAKARQVLVQSADACGTPDKGAYIGLEALMASQVWHPSLLADLSGARALRFMDWGRTNSSQLKSWADRPQKTDAFWTGPHGVPVGVMVNLANTLSADAWINIPPHADDDYARRLGQQVKNSLNPQGQLILEYANEPWNWAFPATHWMREQARLQWPDKVKDDQGNDNTYTLTHSWYGMRAAQLCKIVKEQFGAEAQRVKCVTDAQAAVTWVAQQQLDCPYAQKEMGGQPCARFFDAVSIAPYFGGYISAPEYHEAIVGSWFKQPDGGLDKLFEEIRAKNAADQPVTPPLAEITKKNWDVDASVGGALGQSLAWMQNYKKDIADVYKLPIYSYEGGQHLTNGGRRDCVKPDGSTDAACVAVENEFQLKWQPLFIRANRDPRMGKSYTQMMENWRAAHGQVFMPFNHVSSFSQYGAWGLKESVFKTAAESPKWSALLPYRDTIACWWADCQLN